MKKSFSGQRTALPQRAKKYSKPHNVQRHCNDCPFDAGAADPFIHTAVYRASRTKTQAAAMSAQMDKIGEEMVALRAAPAETSGKKTAPPEYAVPAMPQEKQPYPGVTAPAVPDISVSVPVGNMP
jgi:hypothetical protein